MSELGADVRECAGVDDDAFPSEEMQEKLLGFFPEKLGTDYLILFEEGPLDLKFRFINVNKY